MPEFLALYRQYARAQREQFYGFRFLATVISKTVAAMAGGEGQDFTEDEPSRQPVDKFGPGMPIDEIHGYLKAITEAQKNAKAG